MPSASTTESRPGPLRIVIGGDAAATATTFVEIDCHEGRDLYVSHTITGSTGGYVTLEHLMGTTGRQLGDAGGYWGWQRATSATRTTNVVTVTFPAAHLMTTQQYVVVAGFPDTTFNGVFKIASVPGGGTTLTYACTGSNGSTTGGSCYNVQVVAAHSGGTDIPAANTVTSYSCVFYDVSPFVMLTCNVADGTAQVYAQVLG